MKIGIFGSSSDSQCKHLSNTLNNLGCETLIVESSSLNTGTSFAFDSKDFIYKGINTKSIDAWFLKYIMSPLPPAFMIDSEYYLYKDWFVEYMHKRERLGFEMSWLVSLSLRGVPLVNPPEHGSVIQLKPFQLAAANDVGLKIPRSLITNDAELVKDFIKEVQGVVYKPSMGGGLCHSFVEDDFKRLNDILKAPVTFQECVEGTCVRATIVGDEIVSSVTIESQYLDYRADPNYNSGKQQYKEIDLPDDIKEKTFKLLKDCGLLFSGVDFIVNENNEFIFIEANSSPIYLDIEEKMKHPITEKIANYLIKLAYAPELYKQSLSEAKRTKSFTSYGMPFNPDISIGGPYDKS